MFSLVIMSFWECAFDLPCKMKNWLHLPETQDGFWVAGDQRSSL